MKLSKKNLPEVWKTVCKFLHIKTDVYVEQYGIVSVCSSNSKTGYLSSLHNIDGSFVALNGKLWKLYCDDNSWRIDKPMLIDDFAYHMKQNVYDVKTNVLKTIIQSLKTGIELRSAIFKASSLEEIMLKNDIEVA